MGIAEKTILRSVITQLDDLLSLGDVGNYEREIIERASYELQMIVGGYDEW